MKKEKGPGKGPITEAAEASTTSMPLLAALAYAARGWRVVPASAGSKRPTVKGWPDLATTDTEDIVRWWAASPAANVCITTGRASGIWVLDIDDKGGAGGSAALAALERAHGDLPSTYSVGTGSGGVHHYWTYDNIDFHLGNTAGKIGPGLDTRGDGGQVVAPPSRVDDPAHTMQYVVLTDVPPIAAPAWLVDLLRPAPARPYSGAFVRPTGDTDGLLRWLAGVEPGVQDPALAWAVRRLRDRGLDTHEAADLLRPVVLAWPCSRSPWSERDIERHLRSAYRGAAA